MIIIMVTTEIPGDNGETNTGGITDTNNATEALQPEQ